jgi:hypothetical protein
MQAWEKSKLKYLDEKQNLDRVYQSSKVTTEVQKMNLAIQRYVNRAGISVNPDVNADYNEAQTVFTWLTNGMKSYNDINTRMSKEIRNMAGDDDVKNKLRQVGQLRNDIISLEKELNGLKHDYDVSKTRQDNVEKPRQEISFYQGFSSQMGFTKPLNKISIPFLLGFGFLLLFLSGLMLREFFSTPAGYASSLPEYNTGGVMSLFTNSRFYSAAGGAALVFGVALVLAMSGKLGKTLK